MTSLQCRRRRATIPPWLRSERHLRMPLPFPGRPFDTSAAPSAILEKGHCFSLIVSGFHALLFNQAARRRGGGAWLHRSATAGVLLGAPDADFEWPFRPVRN